MFTFKAYDARGMPQDERKILTQLMRVVEMSPEKDVGVGILTAEDRDVWAKVYASLGQNSQNAASLEAIKRAALVVCLDGGLADADPYEVSWPRQVYKGGPNAECAANRWWDKPVQVIVGEDGGSALLYDHTSFDGTVMAGVTNYCYDYATGHVIPYTSAVELKEEEADTVERLSVGGGRLWMPHRSRCAKQRIREVLGA
ncbi:hypothetical protein HPB47_018276 [Ixodes persulcatus]|uniref:Uncharacterized protein n=1 Tax=Ixodes persulcatus TaxID=34615 RepID=A0AC60QPN4_IXOPE|nr:hypothetical protein HPB47_018276 [Ixodes persulcatus]